MLNEIIEILDNDDTMKEFIDIMAQENYDCGGALYFDDDICKFLTNYSDVVALSSEDFETLVGIVRKKIVDRTEAKIRVSAEADEKSNADEYKYYYGDKESAYWHIFEENIQSNYDYNKSLHDCYRE